VNKHLTIVIPCKNEGKGIIDVVKLLLEQTDCKIIIADSSDDEGSVLLLRKYASIYPNIQIVEGGLPSIARNNGAKLVTTPYILFLDADTYIFNPYLLEDCLITAIKGKYDLVTCKFKTDTPYRWIFRVFDLIQWFTSFTKPFALGGFMMIKTDKFKEVGGFDEEVKIAEDYQLSRKISFNKFKLFNKVVFTTPRRFENKGLGYMIKLFFGSFFNHKNKSYFTKDKNYWK